MIVNRIVDHRFGTIHHILWSSIYVGSLICGSIWMDMPRSNCGLSLGKWWFVSCSSVTDLFIDAACHFQVGKRWRVTALSITPTWGQSNYFERLKKTIAKIGIISFWFTEKSDPSKILERSLFSWTKSEWLRSSTIVRRKSESMISSSECCD